MRAHKFRALRAFHVKCSFLTPTGVALCANGRHPLLLRGLPATKALPGCHAKRLYARFGSCEGWRRGPHGDSTHLAVAEQNHRHEDRIGRSSEGPPEGEFLKRAPKGSSADLVRLLMSSSDVSEEGTMDPKCLDSFVNSKSLGPHRLVQTP